MPKVYVTYSFQIEKSKARKDSYHDDDDYNDFHMQITCKFRRQLKAQGIGLLCAIYQLKCPDR